MTAVEQGTAASGRRKSPAVDCRIFKALALVLDVL
jgi:hypothetical protein